MSLKYSLSCAHSFRSKATYAIEMLALILGESVRPAVPGGDDSDIVIAYGPPEKTKEVRGRHIFISGGEETWRMFEQSEQFAYANAVRCRIDGDDALALFYDEEFKADTHPLLTSDGHDQIIHIDIVAGAFFFLAGWQEWTSEEHDVHKRFPYEASIQYHYGLIETPLVDQYAALLRNALKECGWREPPPERYSGKMFAVMMTHDIDHTRKWTPGFFLGELGRNVVLNRLSRPLHERCGRLMRMVASAVAGKEPYTTAIDAIVEAERRAKAHGAYFFIAGGTDRRDDSYSLGDQVIRSLLHSLRPGGHTIGLHPSYHAYDDKEMMAAELAALSKNARCVISAVREHFLRFSLPLTWRIQDELGFEYDCTMGFPSHEGFRMGTCHPFRVYDVEYDRPLRLWEIPLVMMDDTLQSYRSLDAGSAWQVIERLLTTVKRFRGVALLLFHNTCSDGFDHKDWENVLQKTLDWSVRNEAALLNGDEVLRAYRDSHG